MCCVCSKKVENGCTENGLEEKSRASWGMSALLSLVMHSLFQLTGILYIFNGLSEKIDTLISVAHILAMEGYS